ncbi:hypothetical protein D3C87_1333660 [compost metagenome]
MVEIAFTAALLIVGYFFGSAREKKHLQELRIREHRLLTKVPTRSDRGPKLESQETFLVIGNVVIASDYFKNFVGQLRNFFGGRLSTHETLLDRARREAVCRMREAALKKGAGHIVDVHLETSFLDKLGVEVSAYGTAVK